MPVPHAPKELFSKWEVVVEVNVSPQDCCWGLPSSTDAAIDGMVDEVCTVLLSLMDWK